MKFEQAKSLVGQAVMARRPALLVGRPGVGKSALAQELAEDLNFDFVEEDATSAEPADAKGLPAVVKGKAAHLPYRFQQAILGAERPLLAMIDEIGQASLEVQKPYAYMVHSRKIGGVKIPDCVRFVLATNDFGQKAGVTAVLSNLQSRCVVVNLSPDAKGWLDWAIPAGLHPDVVSFIRVNPTILEDWAPPQGIEATLTERSLHILSDMLFQGAGGLAAYAACIGKQASTFAAHRQLHKALPDFERIIADPSGAKMPERADETFLLASALAYHTNKDNFSGVHAYMSRAAIEYQVMYFDDVITRYPELKSHPVWKTWALENKEVLL